MFSASIRSRAAALAGASLVFVGLLSSLRVVTSAASPFTATARRSAHSSSRSDVSVLYTFGLHSGDGASPYAGVTLGANGAIYGTTLIGGTGFSGEGTVFKLTPQGARYSESVLYSFQGRGDGTVPVAGITIDASGALYGATSEGGSYDSYCYIIGCGLVFKLTPTGSGDYTKTTLHTFLGGKDGANPYGGLIIDAGGALYGTTSAGGTTSGCRGAGCGTVFALIPKAKGYVERILYRFQGGSDGADPNTSLLPGTGGALYGTTQNGGGGPSCADGCGTVFKLTPKKQGGYAESELFTFQGYSGSTRDGAYPTALIVDASGTLFGSTGMGGSSDDGTVFRLTLKREGHVESVLHSFVGGSDGAKPAGLILSPKGALFGTTTFGGGSGCSPSNGCGTIFELTAGKGGYRESVVYAFRGGSDGAAPRAGFIAGPNGALYSTASSGGAGSTCCGTVFRLDR